MKRTLAFGFRYKSGAVHTATARSGATPHEGDRKGRPYYIRPLRHGAAARATASSCATRHRGDRKVRCAPHQVDRKGRPYYTRNHSAVELVAGVCRYCCCCGRTMRSGSFVPSRIRSVMLPSIQRWKPPRPCVAIATRSQPLISNEPVFSPSSAILMSASATSSLTTTDHVISNPSTDPNSLLRAFAKLLRLPVIYSSSMKYTSPL